ncbi:MAG TPA: hypothetical protein VN886_13640 [Acidimicrobiales bacterium]|nr:hypothetical protein [Acidimicrobiales bacterium]
MILRDESPASIASVSSIIQHLVKVDSRWLIERRYSRRVKRLRAGWEGICLIEGESDELRCRVVDISILGLGVTFKHPSPSPSQLGGRRICVDIPGVARLEGKITHAVPVLGSAVRVGIMFDEVSTPAPDITTVESTMGDRSRT